MPLWSEYLPSHTTQTIKTKAHVIDHMHVCLRSCDQHANTFADSYITSDLSQPRLVTRRSFLPKKRQGSTRTTLYLYQTVPKEDFTSLSNATPLLATAGVCLWILDGPYLGPLQGGQNITYKKTNMVYRYLRLYVWYLITLCKYPWNLLPCSVWETN